MVLPRYNHRGDRDVYNSAANNTGCRIPKYALKSRTVSARSDIARNIDAVNGKSTHKLGIKVCIREMYLSFSYTVTGNDRMMSDAKIKIQKRASMCVFPEEVQTTVDSITGVTSPPP